MIKLKRYSLLTEEQQSIYTKHRNYYYSQFPDEDEIAKRVYCCNGSGNYFTNCTTQGGCDEGLLYKGKGFIQLTWKSNYIDINETLQEKVPNENIDIVSNPNTVLETKVGLLSAMGFWVHNNLNTSADAGSSHTVVDSITEVVNLNTQSYDERQGHFDDIYQILEGE